MFRRRFENISPLVFGAACILLTLIISIFAINNYRREKFLMIDSLVRQAETITRFISSSTRFSILHSMRRHNFDQQGLLAALQNNVEQTLEQPGVVSVKVVKEDGTILACTAEDDIGSRLDKDQFSFMLSTSKASDKPVTFRIVDTKDGLRLFQLVKRPFFTNEFNVVRSHHIPFHSRNRLKNQNLKFSNQALKTLGGKTAIIIELDIAENLQVVHNQLLQIIGLSIVLLLVGVGGWLSIITLQRLKGSQSRLKNIEAFRNKLIESLPVGLIATDKEDVIQFINPVAVEIFDISQKNLPQKSFLQDILPGELLKNIDFEQSVTEHTLPFEYRYKNNKGTAKILYVYGLAVIGEKNGMTGKLLLVQDLTRQKSLETDLQRNERFAALGKVAAGVAHELRNPLSSIKGLAHITRNQLPADGVESLNLLVKEVERLDRSIEELLDFTRPDTLKPEVHDLGEIVDLSVRIFATDFELAGIALQVSKTEGCRVSVDADKIKQVLLNLFLNAVQAMENGGQLTVNLARETDFVVCSIMDTGIGMDDETINKVFDPYFTTKPDGTGLGLSITAKIVEDHGGSITIESDGNTGTTVILRFPAV